MVYSETTNLLQREILVRPNLGYIEDICFVFLGLFGAHQLDVDILNRIVASLDGLNHVLDHIVRVLSGDLGSFFAGEILYSLLRFDVDFGIFERAILVITLRESFGHMVLITSYCFCELVYIPTV
jgi:hypothetical protein